MNELLKYYSNIIHKSGASCSLPKCHAMKTYRGAGVKLHAFLNSALNGGEYTALSSGRYVPGGRTAGSPWTGGWVVLRAWLDAVVKFPSQPLYSSPQPSHYTDWATPAYCSNRRSEVRDAGDEVDIVQDAEEVQVLS
jgi:hypothetical protein